MPGASKFTDTITAVYGMYTELSLFSPYLLLSAYYLTIYIYRRMRLTTGVYGSLAVHSHVASHEHGYNYKGHALEQELLYSSIASRILSLTYYTLLVEI